jgi:hypothetical protein
MEKAREIQSGILFQIFNLYFPFSYSLTCSRLNVLKLNFFTFLSFTWHSVEHTVFTCVKYVKLLWYETNIIHTLPHIWNQQALRVYSSEQHFCHVKQPVSNFMPIHIPARSKFGGYHNKPFATWGEKRKYYRMFHNICACRLLLTHSWTDTHHYDMNTTNLKLPGTYWCSLSSQQFTSFSILILPW